MKYSIRESNGSFPSELLRYGAYMGDATNVELEFWARIQELEAALVSMTEDRDSWRERSHQISQQARLSDYYKQQFARILELEKSRDMWKANHDNQVKLKNQLMDRPDLKDRAESILKLNKRIEELETMNANYVRHCDFEESEKLRVESELERTSEWIGEIMKKIQ